MSFVQYRQNPLKVATIVGINTAVFSPWQRIQASLIRCSFGLTKTLLFFMQRYGKAGRLWNSQEINHINFDQSSYFPYLVNAACFCFVFLYFLFWAWVWNMFISCHIGSFSYQHDSANGRRAEKLLHTLPEITLFPFFKCLPEEAIIFKNSDNVQCHF